MSTKPFYNHIGGLRGLAIILVVLFHLNSGYFPHGFYGVDIFLVISGYLLFLSLSRQDYKLDVKEFATKKLFRIFPPMIIMVLLTLFAAMYFQDCEDMVDTARTGRYTLFCYANDFLRRTQDDYFAAEALENPFLHMWYLSVTIHLYLMFAVGCVVSRFLPKKLTLLILWGIGIASFCYGYSYQLHNMLQALGLPTWSQDIAVSHYRTLPRVWEPLAGGAILLLPLTSSKAKATILTLLGLIAAILPAVSPCALADYGVPAVVLGTMLIIRYMPASSLMPVLGNKLLLWVGGISFSLYLVHMPVIAFFHIWYQSISGWSDYALLIALSVLLGWLFWFLVEKRKVNAYLTLGLWAVGMLFCVLGKELDGFKDYLRPEINSIQVTPYDDWKFCDPSVLTKELDVQNLRYNEGVFDLANSTIRAPRPITPLMQLGPASATPGLLLLGDSHAQSAYFGLNRLCHDMNHPGVFLSITTMPFWDKEHYGNTSYYFNKAKGEALMKWLEANPCITHVIIAQFWRKRLEEPIFVHWDKSREPMTNELFYNSFREFVKRIHVMGRHVILMAPGPEIPLNSPTRYIRIATRKGEADIDLAPVSCNRKEVEELNKDILPMLQKLQAEGLCSILDTLSIIPADKPFVSYQDGKFMMYDDDHFSSDGSTMLFRHLRPQLESLLQQPMPAR